MTIDQNKTKASYQITSFNLNQIASFFRDMGKRLDALEGVGQKTVKTGETVYTTEVVRIQSQLDMDGNPINNVGEPEEDADAATKEWVLEKIATETPGEHSETHESGGDDEIKLDDLGAPDDNTDLNASTTAHGLSPKATAPAAGSLNVHAIANAETGRSDKAIFDTNDPEDLGTKGPGSQIIAARRDHVHTLPKLDDLNTPDDTTDLDATAAKHGLMSKTYASKLDGIETAADVTDAENIEDAITGADEESDPEDADLFTTIVSAVLKKITWANIKATLKTYFDTLYSDITHASNHTDGTDDIQDATAAQKGLATAAQITKLDGIEAAADVTDATNVNGAGATMNGDTDVSANSWVLDEDNMASDSATKVPTQQSVKAYADALVAGASSPGEGHITILPWAYVSIGQGTWVFFGSGVLLYQLAWWNTTSADGDNISYKVFLAAGTYTLKILGYQHTNIGICDVDIDAVEVASFDMYGSTVVDQIWSQAGITVSTSGLKTLKLRVDGKNASSTDYYIVIMAIILYRTA